MARVISRPLRQN